MGLSWDVDDRPRHPWTRLYVRGMWLARDKEAFEGAGRTLRTARKEQRSGDAPPTRLTRLLRRVEERTAEGMTVWRVAGRRGRSRARVLYLHGGGYVHPLTPDYWRLVRSLTRAPVEVHVPAYPLAPDAVVDEVLPRLTGLVDDLGTDLPVVLMGDSAGGALTLEVAGRMRDAGRSPVARIVALSPWLDATLSDDEVGDLEATDPMLAESGLRAAGRWWAGARRPDDPLVSPVERRLDGLPPTEIVIGDRDILRPAVDRLAEAARTADVDVHVHEVTAMFHVWMTRAIPEARRERRRLARSLRELARP